MISTSCSLASRFPAPTRPSSCSPKPASAASRFAAKSQKAAEELSELAKANVEAIVEAGRIDAGGAKAIGQDVIASGRDGIEQASDAVKTLAEAKSPAEFFQIQSELARASFDRFVAETLEADRARRQAGR